MATYQDLPAELKIEIIQLVLADSRGILIGTRVELSKRRGKIYDKCIDSSLYISGSHPVRLRDTSDPRHFEAVFRLRMIDHGIDYKTLPHVMLLPSRVQASQDRWVTMGRKSSFGSAFISYGCFFYEDKSGHVVYGTHTSRVLSRAVDQAICLSRVSREFRAMVQKVAERHVYSLKRWLPVMVRQSATVTRQLLDLAARKETFRLAEFGSGVFDEREHSKAFGQGWFLLDSTNQYLDKVYGSLDPNTCPIDFLCNYKCTPQAPQTSSSGMSHCGNDELADKVSLGRAVALEIADFEKFLNPPVVVDERPTSSFQTARQSILAWLRATPMRKRK